MKWKNMQKTLKDDDPDSEDENDNDDDEDENLEPDMRF